MRKEPIQLSDHFSYGKLFRFCVSPIVMMIFTSIYGVVDGYFVSNFVGKTPFAAVNLVMPFIMIFGGVGFMFGTGGSALVAKTLGERRREEANRYFTMMVWICLLCGILISAVGIVFMRPICVFLGAEGEMLEYCVLYGRIVLAFNTAFMLQNLFQSFLITAEKPKLGLYITLAAGFSNMILDALFVGLFRWGVAGAAIASGLSQCIGGVLPLLYFLKPNSSLLMLVRTRLEPKPILRACANGISEVVSSVTASVVGVLYNFQLLKYAGENGVAAYGTLMYVEFVFVAVFIGYAIGSAPIIGFHYGAQNNSELKNLMKKSSLITLLGGLSMVLASELLARPLTVLFVGYDALLTKMTVHAFRINSLVFLFAGFNIFASSMFTALNDGAVSASISFLRTFVFKMSAIWLLPFLFGLDGIWWASVCADMCAFLISLCFIAAKRKKYHYL